MGILPISKCYPWIDFKTVVIFIAIGIVAANNLNQISTSNNSMVHIPKKKFDIYLATKCQRGSIPPNYPRLFSVAKFLKYVHLYYISGSFPANHAQFYWELHMYTFNAFMFFSNIKLWKQTVIVNLNKIVIWLLR